jgi:uncharacterized repeat protein (TIGR03803 family)
MTKNRISHRSAVARFKLRCGNSGDRFRLVFLVCAAVLALSLVASQPAQAQAEPAYTFSVLHTFNGTNGESPDGALITDAAGNLYSTTTYGGNTGCIDTGGLSGCGTVFKLNKNGKQTMLYKFPASGANGANPNVGLVADKAGNLYGITAFGGADNNGTVFKLTASGKETVLYSFTGGKDGGIPNAFLIFDAAEDNLYGTTEGGGDVSCTNVLNVTGCGVVFKVNKTTGKETVLYTFTGGKGGDIPIAALTIDAAGNLYGTAALGGALSCPSPYGPNTGCGIVFKISKATGKESVLHRFSGADGASPGAALYRDKVGNLYSTTFYGGTGNFGTVFKLDTSNKESVLYSFTGGTDGGFPDGALIPDASGNFYSTTNSGGDLSCSVPNSAPGCGVVFMLNKTTGTETVLYSFTGGADGAVPGVSLLRDAGGNLYGAASQGGNPSCSGQFVAGCGTVFKLAP